MQEKSKNIFRTNLQNCKNVSIGKGFRMQRFLKYFFGRSENWIKFDKINGDGNLTFVVYMGMAHCERVWEQSNRQIPMPVWVSGFWSPAKPGQARVWEESYRQDLVLTRVWRETVLCVPSQARVWSICDIMIPNRHGHFSRYYFIYGNDGKG